ncbi:MAG: DUF1343 domain-containing protein, partial [Saprospiraceae bacterium]
IVKDKHLVDTLLKLGVDIQVVFAPEHGFRGKADAGEVIMDAKDPDTGLPIMSLYGKKKKPSAEDLNGIDIIIFDIQDVGVRFYTFISTLHYIMESCAENKLPLLLLDRPNPNAHYIDGPILDPAHKSFVGMHPVPIVYGMTIGEYAQMINGEGWLSGHAKCDLTVIPCNNYTHDTYYELPKRPSPNLPNIRSILLYPSTCFFEGTTLSLGRGTEKQFQVIGHPTLKDAFSFTPMPNEGSKNPPLNGQKCHGVDLSQLTIGSLFDAKTIDLSYVIDFHKKMNDVNEKYFLDNNFFDKLAGGDHMRKQIIAGKSEKEIKSTWKEGLLAFGKTRDKYLIYK